VNLNPSLTLNRNRDRNLCLSVAPVPPVEAGQSARDTAPTRAAPTWPVHLRCLLTAIGFLITGGVPIARSADATPLLASWLAAQTNLQSWSAEVTQTRTLKTLARPLTAQGRVWFLAPNRFRWELGDPPQTLAVRQPEQMLVIYPRLKRAERFPLNTDQPGPWKDALALLEAGFPRSADELESRFKILGHGQTNGLWELVLEPRSSRARRLMPEIKLVITAVNGALQATELLFADGSRLRNEFSRAQINPPLAESLFAPAIDPEFKIVEPAGSHR
jgi:outer membrane lipoprotein-sorting protein